MKRSKFTDSQIMDFLKRVDSGLRAPEVCRELGISTAFIYKWCAKYGSMDTSMMACRKELEVENAKFKKMYIEEKLKAEIVTEPSQKSDEAVSQRWDGLASSQRLSNPHSPGLGSL